ncbi:hypothetical protein [Halanaerobium hydrogeniformans]|uniref:Uncharacterized protein n=1 Tax=Halanaerobium hydrogeniformans TaxID=656519 RepID=E4RIM9_HALHG|nr:hypothetical protein [Halanaerobium hydrogeniformans]ADQ15099.1 hypothetical protein Halsa_1676 [Halanaerobium hydrogeniformans]
MESLIYLLPVLIFFFVVFVKVINTFKKIFNFIQEKAAELEADVKEGRSQNRDYDYDYNYETEQQGSREEYKLAYEEEPPEKSSKTELEKEAINKKVELKRNERMKKEKRIFTSKKDGVSFAEKFQDYSELEKAVLYKEILAEPKALQRKN